MLRKGLAFFIFTCTLLLSPSEGICQRITAEEYKIYALVLRDVYREQIRNGIKKPLLLILSETSLDNTAASGKEPGKMRGLSRSLVERNSRPGKFANRFPVTFQIELIDRSEIIRLIEIGKQETEKQPKSFVNQSGQTVFYSNAPCGPPTWKYFYQRFPRVNEYFRLSRIGYSVNGRFAVVETNGEGQDSSSSWTHTFIKTKKGWQIYQAGGGMGVC